MKANEAPEEIYLLPDDRNPDGLSICWYEAPYSTGAIEYTRTDAFIEKVAKWINEHTSLSEKLVIENFVNYMKGE